MEQSQLNKIQQWFAEFNEKLEISLAEERLALEKFKEGMEE